MGPEQVSVRLRGFQVAASILFCFTIAGLIFGFAALKPILIDSDVYADLCTDEAVPCKKQDTRLNLLFTVASSTTNIAALPCGIFLDRVGPKVSSIAGGIVFGIGCIVFSLRIVNGWLDTYLIGYALLALGSPAMFLAQFHLSNAFPKRSGLVLGAVTGAFDASSLPLVFYKLAYFAHGGKPDIRTFFLLYTIIPALLVIHQIFLGPPDVYTRPAAVPSAEPIIEPAFPRRPSLTPNASRFSIRRGSSSFSRLSYGIHEEAELDDVKQILEGKQEDSIVGAMFGHGAFGQVKSSWWLAMFFMVVVHMTRINWYMATVNTQLIFYTHDFDLADKLTDAFIFLLPLGGILSIPPIGYLLDTQPMRRIVIILGIMGAAFGALTITRSTAAQLIGIAFLTIFRPLFYTAISDYAAKVFGFETFGTVYGLAMTLSGLFGLILTPLDILTKGPLHGSFTPINSVLLVFGLIASSTLYLRTRATPRIELPVLDDDDAILEEDEGDE